VDEWHIEMKSLESKALALRTKARELRINPKNPIKILEQRSKIQKNLSNLPL
jgi:hypothetical protein